ncbi:hypothetical protein BLNAU_4845 [Blattamonas nauphoetae]|uniref:Viral A-type inclusion protein n=1 Tax=Blattamonas nauphoetae TaxID=2049346 RepID=A0ABQ9WUK3_9EUKA|nr:hypothetical protein BLNAU_21930 [Blattamonas nauphoetae]KAK2960292.1 hypothetical protein BLNAU_4845 [Blattamonas nauphoetae]
MTFARRKRRPTPHPDSSHRRRDLSSDGTDPLTKRQKELIVSICFENQNQKEDNMNIEETVADLRMEIEQLKHEARIAKTERVAVKEDFDEKPTKEERMRERDHQMKQKEKTMAEGGRNWRSKLSADQESNQKKESQTNAQFGMLVEDLERTSQQLHRARTEISQLVEKNEKGQREKANLKKTNSHQETQILSMQGENAQQKKAELETEFEMVKKEKRELKEKARAFDRNKVTPETGQHLVTLHNTNSALKQTIQQLEETNRDLEENNEGLQEKVNKLTKQQDALQKQDDIIQETILKLSTIMRQDADEKGLFEDRLLFDDDSHSSSLNSRDRKKRKKQKKAVWISKDEDIREIHSDDLDLGDLDYAETTICQQNSVIQTWQKQQDLLLSERDRELKEKDDIHAAIQQETLLTLREKQDKIEDINIQRQRNIVTNDQLESSPTPSVPQAHEPPMALRPAKNELVRPYASEFHSLINQINKNKQRFPNLSQTEHDVMINLLSSFFVLLLPPSLIQSFTANTFPTLDTAKLNDTIFDSPYVSQLVECQIIPVHTSLLHSRSTHILDHTSLTLIPRPSALNLFVQSAGVSSLVQIVLNLTSLSDPNQFDANVIQSALSSPQSFVSAMSMSRFFRISYCE